MSDTAGDDGSAEVMGLLERSSGPRPTFFEGGGIDQMFSMMMELASEVWVLRERLYVVEDVIEQHGEPLRRRIETWSPSSRQSDELAAMRDAMMKNMFRAVATDAARPD